jgi:hypothetical protein
MSMSGNNLHTVCIDCVGNTHVTSDGEVAALETLLNVRALPIAAACLALCAQEVNTTCASNRILHNMNVANKHNNKLKDSLPARFFAVNTLGA